MSYVVCVLEELGFLSSETSGQSGGAIVTCYPKDTKLTLV